MTSFIEHTARGIYMWGLEIESVIMARNDDNEDYNFLSKTDPFHAFYKLKLSECLAGNQVGPFRDIQPDAPLVGGAQSVQVPPFFTHLPRRPRPTIVLPSNASFEVPAGVTPKEVGVMKLAVQFWVRYGMCFWVNLMERMKTNPLFGFENLTDSRVSYFTALASAYGKVLKESKALSENDACTETILEWFLNRLQLMKLEEGDEMAVIDLHAFVNGADCFAYMEDVAYYSAATLPPAHLSAMMTQMQPQLKSQLTDCVIKPDAPATQPDLEPRNVSFSVPAGITLKEMDIIKLTAQFSARYGIHFCEGLMERVAMNPWFDFMKPSGSRKNYFTGLVASYERVLKKSKTMRECHAATVVDCFFHVLQLDKLEEGDDLAMIDLHSFVSGVDSFAQHVDYYPAVMPPSIFSPLIGSKGEKIDC